MTSDRTAGTSTATPVRPRTPGLLQPLDLRQCRITGGPWGRLQELNRTAVLPHCDRSLETVGWVDNFRALVQDVPGHARTGREFADSEVYKTMEAIAWESCREPSDALDERLAELTAVVVAAQQEDGYLNTYFGGAEGPERYSDLDMGHELYCYGHLIQAGVAAARTGGPTALVDLAVRVADHVHERFGPTGRQQVDGHPEIEPALVELYRVTGDARHLELARLFVERRGRRTLRDQLYGGRDYYQDEVPVRQAEVLVGHAVRALYLAAGAVDVAVETGDVELLAAVRRQYDRTLARRTYLTGGMGAHHAGETFGEDFELPADRAYAETCAGVASVMVAWRLLLATGDVRYADVIERTVYNTVAASPSADGTAFFYVNALQRRVDGIDPEPGVPSLRKTDGTRAAWFVTSCCPTNVARTVAGLGSLVATRSDDGVQVHQYVPGSVSAVLGDGSTVRLRAETAYPADGRVRLVVEETGDAPWTLQLRLPAWSEDAVLHVSGQQQDVTPAERARGAATVRRSWAVGEEVVLDLRMEPFHVHPDPRIDAVRGCVAVQRGPVVYALESPDHPGVDLEAVTLDPRAPLVERTGDGLFAGEVLVATAGTAHDLEDGDDARTDLPYARSAPAGPHRPTDLTFVPYRLWANRGPSTMRVWVPTAGTEVRER